MHQTQQVSDQPADASFAIDVDAHRAIRNYTMRTYVARVAWGLLQPLFRYSPRFCYGWRNLLLRIFGASIGKRVRIYPTAKIMFPWNFNIGDSSTVAWNCTVYSLGEIKIGSNTMISQGTHLCAGSHDYRKPDLPLLRPPITIRDGVWCCAEAFIGPGVEIGCNAVVAARAVVVEDVPPGDIVAGNPAKIVGQR